VGLPVIIRLCCYIVFQSHNSSGSKKVLKQVEFSTRVGNIVAREKVLKPAGVVYDIKSQLIN